MEILQSRATFSEVADINGGSGWGYMRSFLFDNAENNFIISSVMQVLSINVCKVGQSWLITKKGCCIYH